MYMHFKHNLVSLFFGTNHDRFYPPSYHWVMLSIKHVWPLWHKLSESYSNTSFQTSAFALVKPQDTDTYICTHQHKLHHTFLKQKYVVFCSSSNLAASVKNQLAVTNLSSCSQRWAPHPCQCPDQQTGRFEEAEDLACWSTRHTPLDWVHTETLQGV